jgi:serine/threonine protein kinase
MGAGYALLSRPALGTGGGRFIATQRLLSGRYELGPILGRGGMSEVRRGHDIVLSASKRDVIGRVVLAPGSEDHIEPRFSHPLVDVQGGEAHRVRRIVAEDKQLDYRSVGMGNRGRAVGSLAGRPTNDGDSAGESACSRFRDVAAGAFGETLSESEVVSGLEEVGSLAQNSTAAELLAGIIAEE